MKKKEMEERINENFIKMQQALKELTIAIEKIKETQANLQRETKQNSSDIVKTLSKIYENKQKVEKVKPEKEKNPRKKTLPVKKTTVEPRLTSSKKKNRK